MNKSAIGTRIRNARLSAEKTQKELALILDVSREAVSQWENGHVLPTYENLDAIARALRVDLTMLLTGRGARGSRGFLSETKMPFRVPVLPDGILASEWLSMNTRSEAGFIQTDKELSERAFALPVGLQNAAAMAGEFHHNDLVVFDPDVPPQPGDYVYAETDGAWLLRRYRQPQPGTVELVPVNGDWPTLVCNQDAVDVHIVATLMEHRRLRRCA